MTKERRTRTRWLAGLLFCLPGSYVQGDAQTTFAAAQVASSSVEHQRDIMVKVRDGVLLATDIYRPMENGKPVVTPLPVLLHRTPYDKSAAATIAIADTLASRGYVVVVQDVAVTTPRGFLRNTMSSTRTTASTRLSGRPSCRTAMAKSECSVPRTQRTRRPMPPS